MRNDIWVPPTNRKNNETKSMNEWNIRRGSLEARSCSEKLNDKRPHVTGEIIKYSKDEQTVHTIAYWIREDNGYNLKFVGQRPLDEDWNLFRLLVVLGQGILDYEVQ